MNNRHNIGIYISSLSSFSLLLLLFLLLFLLFLLLLLLLLFCSRWVLRSIYHKVHLLLICFQLTVFANPQFKNVLTTIAAEVETEAESPLSSTVSATPTDNKKQQTLNNNETICKISTTTDLLEGNHMQGFFLWNWCINPHNQIVTIRKIIQIPTIPFHLLPLASTLSLSRNIKSKKKKNAFRSLLRIHLLTGKTEIRYSH